jgi:hypothetical protein
MYNYLYALAWCVFFARKSQIVFLKIDIALLHFKPFLLSSLVFKLGLARRVDPVAGPVRVY